MPLFIALTVPFSEPKKQEDQENTYECNSNPELGAEFLLYC